VYGIEKALGLTPFPAYGPEGLFEPFLGRSAVNPDLGPGAAQFAGKRAAYAAASPDDQGFFAGKKPGCMGIGYRVSRAVYARGAGRGLVFAAFHTFKL
jgi:hypothetical protein